MLSGIRRSLEKLSNNITLNISKYNYLNYFSENNQVIEPETANEDGNEYENDADEDEEDCVRYNESNFKFVDFANRLPNPKIIKACGLGLKNFDSNSFYTNHCIVKLLHRIAFDCKMYVMVFQLSIFRTFQKVFLMKELPQYKELVKFATYIVRQFIKVAEVNKKVFMEALFWKNSKECFDIEHGYSETHGKQATQRAWSEEQEDELRTLFMEHKESQNQEDVVDWITSNLIDQSKSRRQVLKKLKELMLLIDYKGRKKSTVSKSSNSWTLDEEANLQELFEQYKETDDPLGEIMNNLENRKAKNRIVEKLLIMGLIRDKNEIRKRRNKQGRKCE
ncbi:hypothetical protein ABEB36_005179 [Hypothenemus hampei]|uniref:Uncharacterized protein n=1 Tax=Hypothenemus hampei TaxID=57062 RepID=A0ABD1EXA8_HYPHA